MHQESHLAGKRKWNASQLVNSKDDLQRIVSPCLVKSLRKGKLYIGQKRLQLHAGYSMWHSIPGPQSTAVTHMQVWLASVISLITMGGPKRQPHKGPSTSCSDLVILQHRQHANL
jgi:hypothetical protein